MSEAGVISQRRAAEAFGVDPHTISDLCRLWRLRPKPMSNGAARGLDERDLAVLARALNSPAPRGCAA